MNKTELQKELKKLGVQFDPKATNKVLEKLLKDAKPKEEGATLPPAPEKPKLTERERAELKEEVKEQMLKEAREKRDQEEEEAKKAAEEKRIKAEEEAEAKKNKIKEIRVLSPTGNFVRAYTAKQSDPKKMKDGKTFIAKAHGYAGKIRGSVRVVYKTEADLKAEAEAKTEAETETEDK